MRKRGFALLGTSALAFLFVFLTAPRCLARSIRSVEADDGAVTVINTAVGFSTVLEFQSKPISAVLGDQDSFKLEYVGNSVTIKPLVARAKSNLFVFTEYERFNCQLVTVAASQVDYIVRIRAKAKAPSVELAATVEPSVADAGPRLVTRPIRRSASYGGFTLTIQSISHERGQAGPRSVTLIDFTLSSRKNPYSFGPASLGVRQAGRFLEIESIYLDSLQLTAGGPSIHGKIALLAQDFKAAQPVALVFAVPSSNPKQKPHRIEVSTAIGKPNEKGK